MMQESQNRAMAEVSVTWLRASATASVDSQGPPARPHVQTSAADMAHVFPMWLALLFVIVSQVGVVLAARSSMPALKIVQVMAHVIAATARVSQDFPGRGAL